MSYIFKTKLLGLEVEVEGVFSPSEPQTLTDTGCSASFEIELITINGHHFEAECLSDETLEDIAQAAFDAASDERGEH
jgi:hypothetical protein